MLQSTQSNDTKSKTISRTENHKDGIDEMVKHSSKCGESTHEAMYYFTARHQTQTGRRTQLHPIPTHTGGYTDACIKRRRRGRCKQHEREMLDEQARMKGSRKRQKTKARSSMKWIWNENEKNDNTQYKKGGGKKKKRPPKGSEIYRRYFIPQNIGHDATFV